MKRISERGRRLGAKVIETENQKLEHMPEKREKLVTQLKRHLVLLLSALIVASGTFVYFLGNSNITSAQVDPTLLKITSVAPSLDGKWQLSEPGYTGYTLWRYRDDVASYENDHYNCPKWQFHPEYSTYTTTDADGKVTTHTYLDPDKSYWQLANDFCDRNPSGPLNLKNLTGYPKWIPVYGGNEYPDWRIGKKITGEEEAVSTSVKREWPNFSPLNAQEVLDQEPFLVVGDDGQSGAGSGFFDRTLEMEVWIPENTINSLSIQSTGLCHNTGNHDLWDEIPSNGRTNLYIQGLDQKILLINSSNCSASVSLSPPQASSLKPWKEKILFTSTYTDGKKYEGYKIIANAVTEGDSAFYVNQFRLKIGSPSHSYLTATSAGTENDLDPTAFENSNTLNISNRLPGNEYKRLEILWETTVYVAPDAKDGCSDKETKYLGIYDSDYPSIAQAWMEPNYPIKMDIFKVDRNDFLEGGIVDFPSTPDETLEFNGVIDKSDERPPQKYRSTEDARNKYVGGNNWEDKEYEFEGDTIYKIRIYNIDQRTWIQIRLPYSQINAIEKCLRKPLVKVYYSDISAGGRFGLGENLDACISQELINPPLPEPKIEASVYTHAKDLRFNSTAWGSSAQYGARVHDEIIGFYSDFPSPAGKGLPNSLQGLTFANNDATVKWGGQFGGRARCMPNYWRGAKRMTDTANPAITLDIGALTENNIEKLFTPISGQFTLTNSNTTDLGLKATIYVEGDLIIGDNIYNNNSTDFNKFNEMGYIYLIAKGDILIDPSVTHIDAVLVAYTEDSITSGHVFSLAILILLQTLTREKVLDEQSTHRYTRREPKSTIKSAIKS